MHCAILVLFRTQIDNTRIKNYYLVIQEDLFYAALLLLPEK
jgi:hypothetical protein